MINFNEENHEYSKDGIIIPSVSEILKLVFGDTYASIPAHILQTACQRGEDIHLICEYDDKNLLDESSVIAKYFPYLLAWREFKKKYNIEIWSIEEKCCYQNRYAGRIDRIIIFDGKPAILDIKTSKKINKQVSLQLAGYAIPKEIDAGYVIQLKENGSYVFKSSEEISGNEFAKDKQLFLNLLELYEFKYK